MEGHTRTEDHHILSAMEEYMEGLSAESISSKILRLVWEPEVKVVSVVFDYEFGNSRLAKFVAEEAMKSEQYGVVIWIDHVRDSSPRKLQMRIADRLGVQLSWVKKERDAAAATSEGEEEEEEDEHVVQKKGALDIFRELFNRQLKLLLVVDFVRSDSLDLRELGFLYPDILTEAKFIFMARRMTELNIPYFKVDRVFDIDSELGRFGDDSIRFLAYEMLVTGARDVADSLRMHHRVTLEPNTILRCIMYLLLMPSPQGRVSVEDLSRYYMGEGLVPLTTDIDGEVKEGNIDRASTVTKALLSEIVNHTIFKFDYGTEAESKDIYVQMDRHSWEALMQVKYLCEDLRIATEKEDLTRESNCKWISLAMKNKETLPPTPPSCPAVTTLLLYGNLELKSIPDHFFEHMTSLRVLDLSRTALTSLPSSISCLRNSLRFINLQNCPSLETLPRSFKHLKSLQLLDLSNTPLSTIPDDSFEHMYNIRLINLSHTKISSLSSSISNCCKLEQLFLKGCQSLETLPPYVFRFEKLQVLDISACTVLGLKEIPFLMPNLRVLNMSECSIQLASLSLKGFLSLETIQLRNLTNLEFLDLSNTKITEFPYEICEMTCLKRLDLVNTRQLKRVQWEKDKVAPPSAQLGSMRLRLRQL
ncbi:hypothetical protein AAC387_Pa01g0763 [Persea americana]